MTPHELATLAADVITARSKLGLGSTDAVITMVTPKGWKAPPRFPRGYLLMVNPTTADRVWHFNALKVIAWCAAFCGVKVEGVPCT